MKVALFGATSKTGRRLVSRLCDVGGIELLAIGRDPGALARLDARAGRRVADLENPDSIREALSGAECVVSLAHARYIETLMESLPESCTHLVLTGSSRKFSRLPDPAADAVRHGEAAFLASGRAGIMLHPTMIYGAPEERNVNRILGYLRRWPRWLPVPVPLPEGGRHTVQPVFVEDVVEAFAAAVTGKVTGDPIVVAGPEPMTYADMVRACAAVLGRRALILPLPLGLLLAGIGLVAAIGLRPPFTADEIRRATEDKSFPVDDLRDRLGVSPRGFADGLRARLERGAG